MSLHSKISDERLNACVDNQLDFEEKRRIFKEMGHDPELAKEAQSLRQLKELVRHAYQQPPRPQREQLAPKNSRWKTSVAASLLFALGIGLGWIGHLSTPAPSFQQAAAIPSSANIILHVNSATPDKLQLAMDEAERLLRENTLNFNLEIMANSDGVDLLRTSTSPYAERIARLIKQYPNVSFMACANTLRQLKLRGSDITLLPGIHDNSSAVDKIVNRLQGGWRYLKV